jgi:hypothetical protein
MKHQITHRFTGKVLFECEVPGGMASGMAVHHALERAAAERADLSSANLSSADLSGANLSGADLSGANLSGADLSGANLSGADLSGADLIGANLRDACLSGADLSDANLSDADLGGADLRNAYLRDAYLRDAYLRGANLSGADLGGAYMSGVDGDHLPRATPQQAIENLDRVREIILSDRSRLNMRYWHGNEEWKSRTCAEETLCGTTHCLAGWLQVCTAEPALKDIETWLAGTLAAPVAAKMFYKSNEDAFKWLESRAYVVETAEYERRAAKRAVQMGARINL